MSSTVRIHKNRLTELCNNRLNCIAEERKKRDHLREVAIDEHVKWVQESWWRRFCEGNTRGEILSTGCCRLPCDGLNANWINRLPLSGAECFVKSEALVHRILKAISLSYEDTLSISIQDLDLLVGV